MFVDQYQRINLQNLHLFFRTGFQRAPGRPARQSVHANDGRGHGKLWYRLEGRQQIRELTI